MPHSWVLSRINTNALAKLINSRPAQRAAVDAPPEAAKAAAEDGPLDGRGVHVALEAEQRGLDLGQLAAVRGADQGGAVDPDGEGEQQRHEPDDHQRRVPHARAQQHDRHDEDGPVVLHAEHRERPLPAEPRREPHGEERLPPDAGPARPVQHDRVPLADRRHLAVRLDVPESRVVRVRHVVPGLRRRRGQRAEVALQELVGVVGERQSVSGFGLVCQYYAD